MGKPEAATPAANPFLDAPPQAPAAPVQAPAVQAPAVQAPPAQAAPESANPFLAGDPAPQLAPQPAPVQQAQPQVIPPASGAPLVAQPGAMVPSVKDPHAEFRRGSWKKPVAFGAIAAGLVAVLFFGIPQETEETAPAYGAAKAEGPTAVIGASVSPEVIPDPTKATLANPNPVAAAAKATPAEAPAPSPDRSDKSDGFGAAFKSAAK